MNRKAIVIAMVTLAVAGIAFVLASNSGGARRTTDHSAWAVTFSYKGPASNAAAASPTNTASQTK